MNKAMFAGGAGLCIVLVTGCQVSQEFSLKNFGSGSGSEWDQYNRAAIEDAEPEAAPEILPVTHFAAGQLFESKGNVQQAALQYRKAIEINKDFVSAYNRLGICLNKLGQYSEADRCFLRAIQIAPEQVHLYNNLGFSCMLQHKWDRAQKHFNEALRRNPEFARARINLGMALANQGHYQQALGEFEKGLGAARANYNIGLVYKSQGRLADAERAFSRALALEPRLKNARKHLDALSALDGRAHDDVTAAPVTSVAGQPQPEATSDTAQAVPVVLQTSLLAQRVCAPDPTVLMMRSVARSCHHGVLREQFVLFDPESGTGQVASPALEPSLRHEQSFMDRAIDDVIVSWGDDPAWRDGREPALSTLRQLQRSLYDAQERQDR